MVFRVLADAVLLLHVLFVAFALLGGLLLYHRLWWAYFHVPAFIWATIVELVGWPCPLTPLENWLRSQGGEAGYSAGFIDHYAITLLYPPGLTRVGQVGLAVGLVAINVIVYWRVLRTFHSRL